MICQECKQNPATLHFTKIVNGEKTEVHLCEKCSQEKSELLMLNGGPSFSINSLLAGLLNIDQNFTPKQQNAFSHPDDIHCEHCHMSYPQFARLGRFGCSNCYKSFQNQLEPILKRLHSGNSTHTGKIPKRIGGNISLRKKIEDLKQELTISIIHEEFEKAAEIRDEIRALEKRSGNSEKRSDLD
ncbi:MULTISPECIES: UvrB/UvrC motif-containing protein [Bacillus]|uniref:UvrB/UvrC motif-containing protein n=1 Tax=Bacillus TaxID=1386 RepID=UPI0002EEDF28|nr:MULTISPECIES: UvrB/UvrC motif-containing protein [Bacillus]